MFFSVANGVNVGNEVFVIETGRGQKGGTIKNSILTTEEVQKLYPVPHRQYVFSIPNILRRFFKYDRKLLGKLRRRLIVKGDMNRLTTAGRSMKSRLSWGPVFLRGMQAAGVVHALLPVPGAGLGHLSESGRFSARSRY